MCVMMALSLYPLTKHSQTWSLKLLLNKAEIEKHIKAFDSFTKPLPQNRICCHPLPPTPCKHEYLKGEQVKIPSEKDKAKHSLLTEKIHTDVFRCPTKVISFVKFDKRCFDMVSNKLITVLEKKHHPPHHPYPYTCPHTKDKKLLNGSSP